MVIRSIVVLINFFQHNNFLINRHPEQLLFIAVTTCSVKIISEGRLFAAELCS